MGRRSAAYRKPNGVRFSCSRGALSVDGRGHAVAVALALSTRAGGMSVEWRLELCAESIAPSSTCAQLQRTFILTMLVRMSSVGAHAGGANGGQVSGGPMYVHTNPPASRTGYALCLTFWISPLSRGSDA